MKKSDRDPLDPQSDPELSIPGLVDDSRKFFHDLLEANRALRLRAAHQEERLAQMEREIAEARLVKGRFDELERENFRAVRELAVLRQQQDEIEVEQRDVALRYAQIEEQYVMLANLYVASYQLHATLRYEDVLRVVKDVLANLVGARQSRIYLRTGEGDLLLVAALGVPGEGEARLDPAAEPAIARVLASGESCYPAPPGGTGPVATVPLRIRRETVGVLVIDHLFEHKPELNTTDGQLFDLLAGHVAVAIFRSRRGRGDATHVPGGIATLADDQVNVGDLLLVT